MDILIDIISWILMIVGGYTIIHHFIIAPWVEKRSEKRWQRMIKDRDAKRRFRALVKHSKKEQ